MILKVIDWRIPCTYIGSFAIFVILFGGHGADGYYLLEQLLGGGLMLGAWFMATDYVTTPITKRGQLVYGVILGCLTGLFRIFGASAGRVLCDHFWQPADSGYRTSDRTDGIWKRRVKHEK